VTLPPTSRESKASSGSESYSASTVALGPNGSSAISTACGSGGASSNSAVTSAARPFATVTDAFQSGGVLIQQKDCHGPRSTGAPR